MPSLNILKYKLYNILYIIIYLVSYISISHSANINDFQCNNNTLWYCNRLDGKYLSNTSTNSISSSNSGNVNICPVGSYCKNGIIYKCPKGRYGNITNQSNSSCNDICPRGFYCPEGTIEPIPCEDISFYCPIGSFIPLTIPSNYYNSFHYYIKLIEPGHFVYNNIKYKCPRGRYGNISGLTNSQCNGYCEAGYRCLEGSISSTSLLCSDNDTSKYCPIGSYIALDVTDGYKTIGGCNISTRTSQEICSKGSYCINGVEYQCPQGYYGNEYGLSYINCNGLCPKGYYCPIGTINPIPCGNTSYYCPIGSSQPLQVLKGYYSIQGDENKRENQTIALKGSYALYGKIYQCPKGTYGNILGLSSKKCSGLCQEGYYCPKGSIYKRQYLCGGPNVYCPEGSSEPLNVPIGYYTSTSIEPCGPGTYRTKSSSYIPCIRCPNGTYKSNTGDDISLCKECNPYTSTSTYDRIVCQCYREGGLGGDVDTLYWNETSKKCESSLILSINNITTSYNALEFINSMETRTNITLGEKGYYVIDGIRYPCNKGRYGITKGQTNPLCDGLCEQGYYCNEFANTNSQLNICGHGYYCPTGSIKPIEVSPGYYLTNGNISYEQLICPKGSYCKNGKKYLCPSGRYGSKEGNINSECNGLCKAGYYCLLGSINDTANECGNASVYCPSGSSLPLEVNIGYYGSHSGIYSDLLQYNDPLNKTFSIQLECPPGSYCKNGIKYPCPKGSYGIKYKETNSLCSGLCTRGYKCNYGSNNKKQHECGDNNVYCPSGSFQSIVVQEGYYSIGLNSKIRYNEIICPLGYYCINGIKIKCMEGYYGNEYGLINSQCSDICPEGYYCPEGTSQPLPCPDGTYSYSQSSECIECLDDLNHDNMPCKNNINCCNF